MESFNKYYGNPDLDYIKNNNLLLQVAKNNKREWILYLLNFKDLPLCNLTRVSYNQPIDYEDQAVVYIKNKNSDLLDNLDYNYVFSCLNNEEKLFVLCIVNRLDLFEKYYDTKKHGFSTRLIKDVNTDILHYILDIKPKSSKFYMKCLIYMVNTKFDTEIFAKIFIPKYYDLFVRTFEDYLANNSKYLVENLIFDSKQSLNYISQIHVNNQHIEYYSHKFILLFIKYYISLHPNLCDFMFKSQCIADYLMFSNPSIDELACVLSYKPNLDNLTIKSYYPSHTIPLLIAYNPKILTNTNIPKLLDILDKLYEYMNNKQIFYDRQYYLDQFNNKKIKYLSNIENTINILKKHL